MFSHDTALFRRPPPPRRFSVELLLACALACAGLNSANLWNGAHDSPAAAVRAVFAEAQAVPRMVELR